MNMTYTLEQIEDACSKATSGPWGAYNDEIWQMQERSSGLRYPIVASAYEPRKQWFKPADSHFVEVARTALPELVARVRELEDINESIRNWNACEEQEHKNLLAENAALRNRRAAGWIPVEERLPKKGECLVVSDGTVYPASVIFGEDFKHCTHWMPLPEPPESREGGAE
jgi:hypothetical protein